MDTPLTKELIKNFKTLHKQKLSWAWDYNPSIPLIGNNFKPGKGLLIYASAENLSWMKGSTIPERFLGEKSWNRYRICYEESGRKSKDFFPDVGIQPATNGCLLSAGLFLSQKYGLPARKTPRGFLETIAVSNWCKFSIESNKNRDYISDPKKLASSVAFVVNELSVLKPKVVLVPKQIWTYGILRAAMQGASPNTKFIEAPQFNAQVVNTHLKKYDHSAQKLRKTYNETPLASWMQNLKRINLAHAWRYIAMLQNNI